jgi:hypothetical protein
MFSRLAVLPVLLLVHSACGDTAQVDEGYDPARDYFAFANTEQFAT